MKALLPSSVYPRIVVIGGGFGGMTLARELRKAPFQVVLLDKHNYHTFQPLLYQVATGGLEPDSIAFPLRKIFSNQSNLVFRIAKVDAVRQEEKVLETSIGEISYEYLVLATGSVTNFFGMEELERHAHGMKSIPESLDLRSLILQNFEDALESEGDNRSRLMNFVVVGGGPTGVETAGALAELQRHVLPHDYPELDLGQMEVSLVEAGPRLLSGMSDKSGEDAKRDLERMGVKVRLNTQVSNYDGKIVSLAGGESYHAETLIWAAGIKGNVIHGIDASKIGRGTRILVNEFNEVEGMAGVFAIGDLALMSTKSYPNGHPQVAPAAIQQAENLAENLIRRQKGAPQKVFQYFDKGSMATIGRNRAVVDFRAIHMNGRLAWMSWMFVHLMFLIGFRNKLVVFVNWVWSYLTYDKGTRLIIRPFRRRNAVVPEKQPASMSV
ncbi:MAG: NAD(P)/FAD-dependent oxidoreductase [Bacteroidia bacterium]|nr:NAD(P)/FAD-dependent oxidoreductase [Bacteroidia bacterium]